MENWIGVTIVTLVSLTLAGGLSFLLFSPKCPGCRSARVERRFWKQNEFQMDLSSRMYEAEARKCGKCGKVYWRRALVRTDGSTTVPSAWALDT